MHHAKEAGDVGAIITFAPTAAREAITVESFREASAHFRTVEPYLDQMDVAEQASILDDWVRSESHLHHGDVLELVARAHEAHRLSGDELALARSLALAVPLYEYMGRPGIADTSAAEAITILERYPSGGDLAFATGQLAWLSSMRSQWSATISFADRAISLAQSSGNDLAMIRALNARGYALCSTGDFAGLELLEEARRRAERGGHGFEECRALLNMTLAVADAGDVEQSIDLSRRAIDTAVRYEIRGSEVHAYAHYAEALKRSGDWTRAEDAASEAALTTYDSTATYVQMVLGSLLARQGRPDALDVLEQNLAGADVLNQMQVLGPAAAARAEFMWLNDESDPDKIERFRAILERGTQMGEASPWRNGNLALWLWQLGELTEIPVRIALPFRRLMEGNPMEAATAFRKKGMPYEQALALMHGPSAARLESLEILDSLGAVPAGAKLRRSLRKDGIAVPRGKGKATMAHASGLTERQAEVLELLAENLANAEIADRLFVSPRTVENHVSAVLSKLGATTRDEAVAVARTNGLVA